MDPETQIDTSVQKFQQMLCPEIACTGIVEHIEDDDGLRWMCAECSEEWETRASLIDSIRASVKRFEHRRSLYVLRDGQLSGILMVPDELDEVIVGEWEAEEE